MALSPAVDSASELLEDVLEAASDGSVNALEALSVVLSVVGLLRQIKIPAKPERKRNHALRLRKRANRLLQRAEELETED